MKNRKTFSPTSLTFYAFLDVTFFFKEFFLDPIQLFKSVMIYDPYNLILMLLVFVASTRFSRNSLRYPSTADNILLVMSTCQNYKIKGFRQNFMNHFYIFTADRRVAIKKTGRGPDSRAEFYNRNAWLKFSSFFLVSTFYKVGFREFVIRFLWEFPGILRK